MKRKLSFFLILALVLTLAACKKTEEADKLALEEVEEVLEEEGPQKEPQEEDLSWDHYELLKLEISPFLNSSWLAKQVKPLEYLLEEHLGQEVQVSLGKDYESTARKLKNKEIHLALLPPALFVLAQEDGAQGLLKSLYYQLDDEGDIDPHQALTGQKSSILLTKEDSPIRSVKDLKGKKVAIANYLSATGFILPSQVLINNGLDPLEDIDWLTLGSHDKVLEAVYNGHADAGFTFSDIRYLFKDKLADVFEVTRLVDKSQAIGSDVLAANQAIDQDYLDKITEVFLEIESSELGQDLLLNISQWAGFAHLDLEDYEELRSLIRRHEKMDY